MSYIITDFKEGGSRNGSHSLGNMMHYTAGEYLCFIYIINSTENLFNKYVSIRAYETYYLSTYMYVYAYCLYDRASYWYSYILLSVVS